MPYIKKEDRINIDKNLFQVSRAIRSLDADKQDGALNYTISKLIQQIYNNTNYFAINRAIGVLECAKQEFYRHIVGPYEETKIIENGDI